MIVLCTPARLEYRELAMRMIVAACRLAGEGLARQARIEFEHHVVSAFGEAWNNVVMHAYPDGDGEIAIEFDPRQDGISMRVFDRGAGFDIDEVTIPDLDDLPTSGLGMFIIRSCMDAVEYTAGGAGAPNVLRLEKRFEPLTGQRTAA
jgi:serine/threonine-protein kinase RsbW